VHTAENAAAALCAPLIMPNPVPTCCCSCCRLCYSTLLLCAVQPAHAQAAAPAPDLSTLPEACVNGGTELQTYCSDTITGAQTFFNVVSEQGYTV
jgi:hypothetical protein